MADRPQQSFPLSQSTAATESTKRHLEWRDVNDGDRRLFQIVVGTLCMRRQPHATRGRCLLNKFAAQVLPGKVNLSCSLRHLAATHKNLASPGGGHARHPTHTVEASLSLASLRFGICTPMHSDLDGILRLGSASPVPRFIASPQWGHWFPCAEPMIEV